MGGAGELLHFGGSTEVGEDGCDFFLGGGFGELDVNGFEVAFADGYAGGCGVDGEVGWGGGGAEGFLGFGFQFVFFALDVGDDVVDDVEAGDSGVSCAAESLHGGDIDAVDAEGAVDGGEGEGEDDAAAVAVCDDPSGSWLLFGECDVVGVYFGDQQGYVGVHAVGAGVGKDADAGFCEGCFGGSGEGAG